MTDIRTTADAADGKPAMMGNFLAPLYLWVAGQQGPRALMLAAGLGAFANLSFPPVYFWPAMAVALTGLVWLLDSAKLAPRPARAAFWRVAAFGYAYYLVGMHWIASAFLVDPSAYLVFIWMPLVALPGGLALLLAAVMNVGFRFWCAGPARLIIFSVAFMFGEWFRSSLFGIGGLPWNLPGMVWTPGGAVSQSASIWGIYGLSALTVVALASPATLADARARGTTGSRAAPIIVSAIVFGAIWGWGAQRLATIPKAEDGPMVRLVEAGVPMGKKYESPETRVKTVLRFIELTGPDKPGTPPIVIWPEGALPLVLFEEPNALDLVSENIGARRLIVGTARREKPNTDDEVWYNSLAVMSGDASERGPITVYDKHMLVPFGEFMPFADVLTKIGLPRSLQRLAPGGFTPGPMPFSVRVVGMPEFGPLICYEDIFPGLSPTGFDRPRWLVNISNDGWFGQLTGPHQHAAQARYRSIEEGLPMARVASGGLTGMIDAYGRWTARGHKPDASFGPDPEGWKASVVDAAIPPIADHTPYSRWRDGMFWLILLGLNLGLLALPRR
jgi:apolipoprotein N-acyltransferase